TSGPGWDRSCSWTRSSSPGPRSPLPRRWRPPDSRTAGLSSSSGIPTSGRARIGGKPPELLLVSSMQIHSASAYRLIDDAYKLGENRPLILAGGAKAIYEPWDFFGLGPDARQGADVVVTGEEFVLLELLDRLLDFKAHRESWRLAFARARSA